jgi:hypothetical protein
MTIADAEARTGNKTVAFAFGAGVGLIQKQNSGSNFFSYHRFHQGSANRQVNSAALVEVAHGCNGTAKMVVTFQDVVAYTYVDL